MKRLLIACDTDYNTLRAINILGTQSPVFCLAKPSQNPPPYCTHLTRNFSDLIDDQLIQNIIDELNLYQFDEVYLSSPSIEHAKKYSSFLYKILSKNHFFILSDRILKDLDALKYSNEWAIKLSDLKSELKSTTGDSFSKKITPTDLSLPKSEIPLYAIIGTYCEEDIIYSTVKHAFLQGAEKVFIIDNASSDNTVKEALAAGAILHSSFTTNSYNEMERIFRMNEIMEDVSLRSKHNEIWWMWLDADEFLEAPNNHKTLKSYLKTLPNITRTVGSKLINYFPTQEPAYSPREHPRNNMKHGEVYDTKTIRPHCQNWHWKHSVLKWKRHDFRIRARTGFHVLNCNIQIAEADETISLHHFPFREKNTTLKRYSNLCETTRNSNNDSVSIANESTITKRYKNLQNIYNKNWDKVYIYSGELKSDDQIGVSLSEIPYSGPTW